MKCLHKEFSDGNVYLFSFANGHKLTIFYKKIPSGITIFDNYNDIVRHYSGDLLQALKSELKRLRHHQNKTARVKYKIQELIQIIHYAKQYISI